MTSPRERLAEPLDQPMTAGPADLEVASHIHTMSPGVNALQPRNLTEAVELSRTLAMSSLVPYALRGKPADVLVLMMYGMELGISVIQATRGINVIKGRASLSTELRVAKTRERGHMVGVACVECGQFAHAEVHNGPRGHKYEPDSSAERCTVRAVRRDTGETAVVTWTIEQAIAAKLCKRAENGQIVSRSDKNEPLPWETYTADMLYNRAADRACKRIAPEVAYGLYTAEEIEQMPAEPTRVEATVGEPMPAPDPDEAAAQAAALQAEFAQDGV